MALQLTIHDDKSVSNLKIVTEYIIFDKIHCGSLKHYPF